MTGQSIPACEAPAPGTVPGNAAVQVWWYDSTETGPAEVESLARTLPADQQAAAARFGNNALRRRHIVAHAMTLEHLLGASGPSRIAPSLPPDTDSLGAWGDERRRDGGDAR